MPNCPECNTPNAYVGFFVVECLNPQCRNYVCAHGGSSQTGQAFVAASPLPAETQAAVDEFMNGEFAREVQSIQEAVGNAIPVTMDFRNVGGNLDAVRLLIRVLRRLRSTLCLRSGQHKEQSRAGVQRVAVRHTAPGERKSCTFAQGVLDMIVCLDDQKTLASPSGGIVYDENDIDKMVADTLDLELGPAIQRLQEWLLNCIAEANENLRLQLKLDVDWKSFTSSSDNSVNLQVLARLEQEFHQHILYWLRSHAANNKEFRKQLKKVLHSVRVEHAPNAAQRELYVDGTTIVYRLCVTGDGGAWGYELGDVLMSAVMSVQPPPAAEDVAEWLEEQGDAARQELARISDGEARRVLERFLQHDLPPVALRIQDIAGFPVKIELDWKFLSTNLELTPRLIPRVLNRVCGALTLVAGNEVHESLLQDGAVEAVAIAFTHDPAAKSCVFDAPVLRLTVCVEQPGAGCFDESLMANCLNQTLAIDGRLGDVKLKTTETAERLCEALGTWIDIDVEWDGFLNHPDSGAVQRTLMELSEVGLGWVYYALTGQSEEEPEFKARVRDRVRAIRFVHIPSPKDKKIIANGSTLVYQLHLHEGYTGRFIIDHLKEIFDEVVETMAPGAPISQMVLNEFERFEREDVPAAEKKIAEALGHGIAIRLIRDGFGNNLIAVRALKDGALAPILEAIHSLTRQAKQRKQPLEKFETIVIGHVSKPDDASCSMDGGELRIETCLESGASDTLSANDILETIQKRLLKTEEQTVADDRTDEDDSDEDEDDTDAQSGAANDAAAELKQFRNEALQKLLDVFNLMNGASIILDGDWDAFEDQLKSPAKNNVQVCLYSFPQVFLSVLMQLQMMNPTLGETLKKSVKIIRFACTRPRQQKDIKLDSGVLIYRLKPEDGMQGGFDQAELLAKLPQVLSSGQNR